MDARMKGMTLVLAVLAMAAVGCQDKEKIDLQAKNAALQAQNDELREQLNKSEQDAGQIALELSLRKDELTRKDAEIASLKARPAVVVGPGPVTGPKPAGNVATASGWEKGLLGDKVSIGSDILFASGQASLSNAGRAALDRIIADIKGNYAGLPVRVYGYTDSDAIAKTRSLWQDNLDLSANRAMAVTRYLLAKGVKAEQVETVAMGPANPVGDNKTVAGKAKNRRVEIVVVKG